MYLLLILSYQEFYDSILNEFKKTLFYLFNGFSHLVYLHIIYLLLFQMKIKYHSTFIFL